MPELPEVQTVVSTLRPKPGMESAVRLTYGSYNYFDALVDYNQKLGDHAALRLAGSWLDPKRRG